MRSRELKFEVETASRMLQASGMDHVRVHPKFLHSNATSHKWVLGAFAELLDNSLDEVCNGATFVNVDMLKGKKDGGKMLRIEDNGGGMDPDKMRQCISLGYSVKSEVANTIGQYGNGFKTSTMRLGADAIVFSRCCGKDGKRPTQSIGLLSYTFLRSTGKEDIVVPMLDYERGGQEWNRMKRSSVSDWNRNLETIVQWSPFLSEVDLLQQNKEEADPLGSQGMNFVGGTAVILERWLEKKHHSVDVITLGDGSQKEQYGKEQTIDNGVPDEGDWKTEMKLFLRLAIEGDGGKMWHERKKGGSRKWFFLSVQKRKAYYDQLCSIPEQFSQMEDHGTRIIIYNLWEDDQGQLELDFDADPHDIQIRGVNRDEKNIQMAKQFPNSKHFLTYRHSLRCINFKENSLEDKIHAKAEVEVH
ncbi:hypothetical protein TEA_030101 [Camellia sinensis var. sinensis]|uniref:Morc S5 domain-containing protein n=1 Tax=Camellia sinensis var. sinensis TaxID=542762 RepID=A0A4V3WLS2_CAMSN|nr:hypothetical protein TEA_030101 [Camellia sinensis var. sinensis]